jgi:hypothetical protein
MGWFPPRRAPEPGPDAGAEDLLETPPFIVEIRIKSPNLGWIYNGNFPWLCLITGGCCLKFWIHNLFAIRFMASFLWRDLQPQHASTISRFSTSPTEKTHNSSFRLLGGFKPPRLVIPTAGAWDPISRCSSACRPWILVHALRKVRELRVAAALDGVGPWIFWIHRGPTGKSTIVGGCCGGQVKFQCGGMMNESQWLNFNGSGCDFTFRSTKRGTNLIKRGARFECKVF